MLVFVARRSAGGGFALRPESFRRCAVRRGHFRAHFRSPRLESKWVRSAPAFRARLAPRPLAGPVELSKNNGARAAKKAPQGDAGSSNPIHLSR
jgi:hypothetical protein